MQCYDTLAPIAANGTAVALGYFDGVHLGHRSVLRAAQAAALRQGLADAVFTFTLPDATAAPSAADNANRAATVAQTHAAQAADSARAQKGRALLTQTEKRRRMQACGVQHYFCPPFESFRAFSPAQFVDEILVRCLGARAVFCGDNFTFGAKKSGDVALLRTLCAARGIDVCVTPLAQYAGQSVSSSRIRAALAQGDIAAANAMLGEAYRIDLPVRHGKQLGRTLGFPTINQVYPDGMQVPAGGVYLTRTRISGASGTSESDLWLPSATGLGTRPTVTAGEENPGVTCETFIADYTGELYGEAVSVEFHAFWQPTRRFASLEELKHYIGRAADAARTYFAR